VHGDEGVTAPLLVEGVNGTREDLFTGPGFTLQKDGGVADLRGFVGTLQHGIHPLACRDESEPVEYLAERFWRRRRLNHRLARYEAVDAGAGSKTERFKRVGRASNDVNRWR
jgi:hypothetical protein